MKWSLQRHKKFILICSEKEKKKIKQVKEAEEGKEEKEDNTGHFNNKCEGCHKSCRLAKIDGKGN